jgi:hypothetical protein
LFGETIRVFLRAVKKTDGKAYEAISLAPAPARGKPEEGKTYPEPEANCPKTRVGAGEWLRRQEASATFAKRYATRAAIEGTISEGKRAHGAGRLRVRREGRVKLATYFKWLACNVKRALRYWLNVALGGSPAAATACAEGAATRGEAAPPDEARRGERRTAGLGPARQTRRADG